MKANSQETIDNILKEAKSIDFSSPDGRQFLSDAYVALSIVDLDLTQRILRSTHMLEIFQGHELKVKTELKDKTFEFFWELGTLQLIVNSNPVHYSIKRYSTFVEELDLDLNSIEGIISAGFLIQPEIFKTFQLSLIL